MDHHHHHHHSPKKAKIAADDVVFVTIDQLDDVLADVFGWLRVEEIMGKRCVCKKWKKATKITIVPPTDFRVNSEEKYNAVNVMSTELTNLQQISICHPGIGHKYSEGEDPDEELASAISNWTTHDIEIISNFSKLRDLKIFCASLNGRYPFLFSSFPLLQKLDVSQCEDTLKWDLEMLAGLPLLKQLYCYSCPGLIGNTSSLRVLKDTLEKVTINSCWSVEGNFMDLADFPDLKELNLIETAVIGDIRDIGENDFSTLEFLRLPRGVYGGHCYEFRRISDGPDVVRAIYLLKKQRAHIGNWFVCLSIDSPDRYEYPDRISPPFNIQLVQAGSRLGYQWYANPLGSYAGVRGNTCEVNWLDPEPDREDSDYGKYIEELQEIERRVGFYKGFHQPPTEEEYDRLLYEHYGEQSLGSRGRPIFL